MTSRERETLRRFVAQCERRWPGCKVTVRHNSSAPAFTNVMRGYAEQHTKFLQQQESPPERSGNQQEENFNVKI